MNILKGCKVLLINLFVFLVMLLLLFSAFEMYYRYNDSLHPPIIEEKTNPNGYFKAR